MRKLRKANERFERNEVSREEALEIFADNPYKVEIINELPEDATISTYRQGNFPDLCRPARRDDKEDRPVQVSRASPAPTGAATSAGRCSSASMAQHGRRRKSSTNTFEKLKRRKSVTTGGSARSSTSSRCPRRSVRLILWHPNGAMVRYLVEQFEQQEQSGAATTRYTPHIASERIYQISGHLQTYGENMYSPMSIEEVDYYLKPMNCPGHIMIYKGQVHSYRELPVRYAELGTVYRYERSGTLHGMLRVRGFTQDDAHIFCTHDQVVDEVGNAIDLALHMADIFGYGFEVYLGTRPEKAIGSEEIWNEATDKLKAALAQRGLDYILDEGEGAFYGRRSTSRARRAGRVDGPTIQSTSTCPSA